MKLGEQVSLNVLLEEGWSYLGDFERHKVFKKKSERLILEPLESNSYLVKDRFKDWKTSKNNKV